MSFRIAIQGGRSSFHDVAARTYFAGIQTPVSSLELVESSSFPILCKNLQEKRADVAVMAIENSIAGSILPNYSLLEAHGFKIKGELYLRIELQLMALPGQQLHSIRFVKSHPIALLQCEDFLLTHPEMTVLEGSDTAKSAEEVQRNNLVGQAAIAGRLAAETYGLQILREGIESNKQNYTRFLVICRQEDYVPLSASDKASIRFEVPDRPGSLVEVLEIFDRCFINMTKLQSVVIPGRPYQYSFHVDLEWKSLSNYERAMDQVKEKTLNLIHFGVYPRGVRPNA